MQKIKYVFICLLLAICVIGCESAKKVDEQPQISRIRVICDLATLETYYHNVAKLTKPAGLFQKERVLWIEYTGVAKIGIDMSLVDMKIEGNRVIVTMPPAKLLSATVSEIDKESFYYSEDNKFFFKNEITAEDETSAVEEAQKNMRSEVENNNQLLANAQERAKDLIEKYIKELGNLSGIDYKIEWV